MSLIQIISYSQKKEFEILAILDDATRNEIFTLPILLGHKLLDFENDVNISLLSPSPRESNRDPSIVKHSYHYRTFNYYLIDDNVSIWQHINFYGGYDFTEKALEDEFDMYSIKKLSASMIETKIEK